MEGGSPSAGAQPRPHHGIQPEEPGCPGCLPSAPQTAQTSPKTQPAHPGSMLPRQGAARAHGGGPGATSITHPLSSHSPFAALHLPQPGSAPAAHQRAPVWLLKSKAGLLEASFGEGGVGGLHRPCKARPGRGVAGGCCQEGPSPSERV